MLYKVYGNSYLEVASIHHWTFARLICVIKFTFANVQFVIHVQYTNSLMTALFSRHCILSNLRKNKTNKKPKKKWSNLQYFHNILRHYISDFPWIVLILSLSFCIVTICRLLENPPNWDVNIEKLEFLYTGPKRKNFTLIPEFHCIMTSFPIER